MIGKIADMSVALSRRERILLGLLAGVALPAGIWFGVLLPLQETRETSRATLNDTKALYQWVVDRSHEANQLRPSEAADTVKTYVPIGLSGLEEGLRKVKLWSALTELGTERDGIVSLRFDEVDFIRLATWLSSSHPEWGYVVISYQFDASPTPSRVSARVELRANTSE